jgi:hypothetical protein
MVTRNFIVKGSYHELALRLLELRSYHELALRLLELRSSK